MFDVSLFVHHISLVIYSYVYCIHLSSFFSSNNWWSLYSKYRFTNDHPCPTLPNLKSVKCSWSFYEMIVSNTSLPCAAPILAKRRNCRFFSSISCMAHCTTYKDSFHALSLIFFWKWVVFSSANCRGYLATSTRRGTKLKWNRFYAH